MALRVLLVALVAAMGLELPDSARWASWDRSARGWVADRMTDLASLSGDEAPAPAPTDAAPNRGDLAFEVASEAMASGFSTDLAAMRSGPIAAAVEPEGEPAPEVVPAAQAPRTERVSEAVRLTRQAVDAWASLIRPAGDQPVGDGESAESF